MTLFQYSQDPLFPDRYTRDKGWVRVLPIHGRPLQTAELIEMQTILHDNLKQGMDTLFATGAVLSGLRFTLVSQTETQLEIAISAGQLYVEGVVLDVAATTLHVPAQGAHSIGVLVQERIITEVEDPELRDPVKGGARYGLEGAARLTWAVTIELNDTNAFTIGKVIEGSIVQKELNPFSKVESTLAQYTYERSGNFCVNGFDVSVLPSEERAVSDKAKYAALRESVDAAQQASQQSLSDANQAQAEVDNLKQQLDDALEAARISPTNQNLTRAEDLRLRVQQAEDYYNQLARLVVSKTSLYQKASQDLSASNSLLVDKVLFSVSPGVAYVEGYRINRSSPATLAVPKDLATTKVESAVFTYSGRAGVTQRTLSLSNITLSDVKTAGAVLVLNVGKALYEQQFVDIKVEVKINATFTGTTLSDLLDFIVAELNKPAQEAPSTLVTFSSTTLSLTSNSLRTILKNNVVVTKQSNTALLFQSTSISEDANQIAITLSVLKADKSAGYPGFLIDVAASNLAGAGRSNSFQLGFRPVAEVVSLIAEMAENMRPIVRGSVPGTTDKLGDDSIFRLTKVVQGNTVYVEGVDYRLLNQSQIDWSLSGSEPAPGTTYYVSFLYTQPLVIDKDFKLEQSTDSIIFIGNTPAPNQNFTVTYSYYLAKAGVITLDRNGELGYVLSPSSSNPLPPEVPATVLPIATFKLYANGQSVAEAECRAVKFSEMYTLADQVRRNTCNLEVVKLDNQAYRKAVEEVGTNPIGMFTNTIQDASRLQMSGLTATISPSIQAFTGGYAHKDVPLKYQSGGTLAKNVIGDNSFVTLPYSNREVLSQQRLTTARSISVISASNARGKLYASPSILFHNEGLAYLTPCDYLAQKTSFLTRTSENSPLILASISNLTKTLFKAAADKLKNALLTGDALNAISQDGSSFLGLASTQAKAKPVPVKVMVTGLVPNSEGYKVYLAGKEIKDTAYTKTNSTPASAQYPGTLKAKADGKIHLTLTLPKGLSCGVHTLELVGPQGYCRGRISIYNNLLSQIVMGAISNWDAVFAHPRPSTMLPLEYPDFTDEPIEVASESLTGSSTLPEIQVKLDSLSRQYPVTHSALNQTFELPGQFFITQVKLKVKAISTTGEVRVLLKEADDLGPIKVNYGIARAQTYDVDATGVNWTTFKFAQPILVQPKKKYCLSVEATSTGYEIFTAEVGIQDLITKGLIGDQLFLQGTLFSSLDGLSTSELKSEDLCFEVDVASFIKTALTVNLGTYGAGDNFTNVSFFCLNSRDIVPPGTSITYEYKTGTKGWTEFQANSPVCLETKTSALELRATLQSTSNNVSPVLSLEGTSVSLYAGVTASSIISKVIHYPEYRNVTLILQYVKPQGTNIKVYYSPIDPAIATSAQEWRELSMVGTETYIDQGLNFVEAKFSATNLMGTAKGTEFRYKIDLTTQDPAIQPIVKNVISYVY